MPPADLRALSSHERGNEAFVTNFFGKSRLHWIGTWNDRYEEYLEKRKEELGPLTYKLPSSKLLGGRRVVFHVDMDAFFATVSSLGKPFLGEKTPVAVAWGGGDEARSEISSANYPARAFGVKAGMWMREAKKLCPQLVVEPFDFEKYTEVAKQVYSVLFSTSPFVRGLSCDEAYVDVTHLIDPKDNLKSAVTAIAKHMRSRIFESTGGCAASIGIGHSELVARIATKHAKPDNLHFVSERDELDFLSRLAVREFPGVGRKTSRLLESRNIKSGEDIRRVSLHDLQAMIGKSAGKQLHEFAHGIDNRKWDPRPVRKSISAQISWGVRLSSNTEACDFIRRLSSQVSNRLKRTGHAKGGRRVGLKVWIAKPDAATRSSETTWIGHGSCDVVSRMYALSKPSGSMSEIFQAARALLLELRVPPGDIRGLGVVVSKLERSPLPSSSSNVLMGAIKAAAEKRPASSTVTGKKRKRNAHDCATFQPAILDLTKLVASALAAPSAMDETKNIFAGVRQKLSATLRASREPPCQDDESSMGCVRRWAEQQKNSWSLDFVSLLGPDADEERAFFERAREDWTSVVEQCCDYSASQKIK